MDFLNTAGDLVWALVSLVALVALVVCLMTVFVIIGDLFRDGQLSGSAKAGWVLCLVLLPLITALTYLVVRGNGVAERAAGRHHGADAGYGRSAATTSPAEEIVTAKKLLDAGAISREEFDRLKVEALSTVA